MVRRIFCIFLSSLLLFGLLTIGAGAAEEAEHSLAAAASEEMEEAATDEDPSEKSAVDWTEEPESEDSAGEWEENEESAVEQPVENQYSAIDLSEFDPEDPLYARYAALLETGSVPVTDGASSAEEAFSKYTTRELNNETLRLGIDVSAWQGTVDWDAVADSGIEFVIIRAAYRGVDSGSISTDSRFEEYIAGAQAAGLRVGAYIYSQAITVEEGREEAEYILNLVSGYSLDLPVVIDYEYYEVGSGRLYNAHLSQREATDICNVFCEIVEDAGYDSMVYGNASMFNNQLYADELIGKVWLAHWTTQTTYSGNYEFWQPGIGTISGISGDVDLDFWFEPNKDDPSASHSAGEESRNPFQDVSSSDWYYTVVLEAYEVGIVNGVTETTFEPNQTATRGQVVTMIYRMEGEPAVSQEASFTDLTDDYYHDAVCWAEENDIVNGYSETSFGPERSITREELVTVLYRLAGSPETTEDLSGFGDEETVQSYARSAMEWAVSEGIITGYEDNTLRPQGAATRAEVCAMLMRYTALPA